ncbi:putative aliphatic sulfonates transport permease protein SsuC [invertebrate metagenome]|uniref:Putative aliphatic sulfonates transport permease protein SsuC n=1 Tax=invertebrate metagenome TaxID=1711999 RepID=A0A2H9T7X3_9ZZZZ
MPIKTSGIRKSLVYLWGYSLCSLFIGLLLWEWAVWHWSDGLLPSPIMILRCLWEQFEQGNILVHFNASSLRFIFGLFFGMVTGVIVGFCIAMYPFAFYCLIPWLALLFPIPKIAFFPVLIVFLGVGEASRIMTISIGVFMPSVICAWLGVRSIPQDLLLMAHSFSLSRWQIFKGIIFPGSLPYLLLSVRLSITLALILLITAEMLGAQTGIGAFILASGSMGLLDQLFAGVLVISVSGLFMVGCLGMLELKILHWQRKTRWI